MGEAAEWYLLGRFHLFPQQRSSSPPLGLCLPSLLLCAKDGRQAPRQGCLAGQLAWAETHWRSWPLFRPTSTVQMHNENSGLGIYLPASPSVSSPTSGLSSGLLKPSSSHYSSHGSLSCPASLQPLFRLDPSICLGRVPGLPHQLKHPVLCVRVYCLTNKGSALLPALIRPPSFVLFPAYRRFVACCFNSPAGLHV